MTKGSISSIETLGLLDGPGIRVVVFLNGCLLRCKYCHNPEMWKIKDYNYTKEELVKKILRYKPYFNDQGGVTFSGGEPLLQSEFLLEVIKDLKKEHIHVALDTSGVSNKLSEEILKLVDLVIFDVKHIDDSGYKELTGLDIEESLKFIELCNKLEKKLWIRQVIIPEVNDNKEYIKGLHEFLKKIKGIEKVEFLPYHKLAINKYEKLGITDPYKDKEAMSKEKCNKLYEKFLKAE
jgi:pyruvate formate-lyase 1-activating enzyme